MKNTFLKIGSWAIIALFVTALSLSACRKDKSDIKTPAVPPSRSMEMDFSKFSSKKDANGLGHGIAALTVGIWQTILNVTLALPVASFKEAMNHEPVEVEANHWTWSYSVPAHKISAILHARYADEKIKWEMVLSQEGGPQNFTWFTGTSNPDGKSGQWVLNKDAQNAKPFLQIDWTKADDNISSIKYTNILTGDSNETSYIQFGHMSEAGYDRFYTINMKANSESLDVQWNETMGNGRVRKNAGNWWCWGAAAGGYADVLCQ